MSLHIKTDSIQRRRASFGEVRGHTRLPSGLVDVPTTPTPRSVTLERADAQNPTDTTPLANTPKGGFFNDAPYKLKIAVKNGEPLEIASKDFAKQITLISSTYFRAMKRKELEQMGWTGNSKKTLSPSIVKITTHFNQLAHFTSQKILEAEKIQIRLQVLIYFIHVANYCLQFDNYDGVKSVLSGLQSTPVHRLNRSWALVGRKEREMFIKLQYIVSLENNHEIYRRKIGAANPPLIPYLGIHLTDFTYIYECLKKDKDKAERKAQYKERLEQFNQMLDEIAQMQSSCFYSFPLDFKFTDSLEQAYNCTDEEQKAAVELQYELSYKLEPRGEAIQKDDDWRQSAVSPKIILGISENIKKNVGGITPLTSQLIGESESLKNSNPTVKRKSRRLENNSNIIPEDSSNLDEIEPLEWAEKPESVRRRLLKMIGMSSTKKKSRPYSVGDEIILTDEIIRTFTASSSAKNYSNLDDTKNFDAPRTTTSRSPPSILAPQSSSELKGKLHLQAILHKKEEFDAEGNRSTDRRWVPFLMILDGTTLTLTSQEAENPPKQKSLPILFAGIEKSSPTKSTAQITGANYGISVSLKEKKLHSRPSIHGIFKNLDIRAGSSPATSGANTSMKAPIPIEKPSSSRLETLDKQTVEKNESRSRTLSYPTPVYKTDSTELASAAFMDHEDKSDIRRKPDIKINRKPPSSLITIDSGASMFPPSLNSQESSSEMKGLLSNQSKSPERGLSIKQEARCRTISSPASIVKPDYMADTSYQTPFMQQDEQKSSIQRKPVMKPNRKISMVAAPESFPSKLPSSEPLPKQSSNTDFKVLQSSMFRSSLSSEFFNTLSANTEVFQLDHFARVNRVDDHKKRFVFRAMIQKQRSFLVRASTDHELELWIQAIRMAIEVFKHAKVEMEDVDKLLGGDEAEQLEFQNFMLSSAEEDLLAGKIPSNTAVNQNDAIIPMPLDSDNQPGSAHQKATASGPIWTLNYWRVYFDIDTKDVGLRMLGAVLPTMPITQQSPDLYGPFWIPSTVIFALFATSTVAASIAKAISQKPMEGIFDIGILNYAAATVYSYVLLMPALYYGIGRYYSSNSLGLFDLINIYGYGMTIWIPASLLCVIPSEFLRWIISFIAFAISTWFIFRSVMPMAQTVNASGKLFILGSLVVCQFGIALLFLLQFFSHVATAPSS